MRILNGSLATLEQAVPEGKSSCSHLFARGWIGNTARPRPRMWPTQHWVWPSAPGLPLGAQGRSSLDYPTIAVPSIGTNHFIPTLATGQQPPAILQPPSMVQAAVSPPRRPAEPYTVEIWFNQIRSKSSNNLYIENFGMYMSTVGFGHPVAANPTRWSVQGVAGARRLTLPGDLAPLQVCSQWSMVDCPRSTFEERCTPEGRHIALNDTCRQTAVWPRTHSPFLDDVHRNAVHTKSGSAEQQVCPPWWGPSNISALVNADREHAQWLRSFGVGLRAGSSCATTDMSVTQQGTATSSQETPRWHQVLETVWPPGTVAVLPYDIDVVPAGDAPDYAWRINRGYVIAVMLDSMPSGLTGAGAETGTGENASRADALCAGQFPGAFPLNPGSLPARRVILDDASCVVTRSCSPDTGTSVERNAS